MCPPGTNLGLSLVHSTQNKWPVAQNLISIVQIGINLI